MLHDARAPNNPALVPHDLRPVPPEVIAHVDRPLGPIDIVRLTHLWWKFISNLAALDDPLGEELTAEIGALLWSQFNQLRSLGLLFCEHFTGIMEVLRWELRDGETDGDSDDADQLLEMDDPDEDEDLSDFERSAQSTFTAASNVIVISREEPLELAGLWKSTAAPVGGKGGAR